MDSQEPSLNDRLPELIEEVFDMLESIDVGNSGDHMYSNYEKVTGYLVRLQSIHNDISLEEIRGRASAELRKFRTAIVDDTIIRLEKVSAFESRKITVLISEMNLERK